VESPFHPQSCDKWNLTIFRTVPKQDLWEQRANGSCRGVCQAHSQFYEAENRLLSILNAPQKYIEKIQSPFSGAAFWSGFLNGILTFSIKKADISGSAFLPEALYLHRCEYPPILKPFRIRELLSGLFVSEPTCFAVKTKTGSL
jgi:hypothetical protein